MAAQQIIIITGPTGVGKTDCAERLAAHLPIEIINAEAAQKEARINYYSALYDAIIAKVDLEKATGTLAK